MTLTEEVKILKEIWDNENPINYNAKYQNTRIVCEVSNGLVIVKGNEKHPVTKYNPHTISYCSDNAPDNIKLQSFIKYDFNYVPRFMMNWFNEDKTCVLILSNGIETNSYTFKIIDNKILRIS